MPDHTRLSPVPGKWDARSARNRRDFGGLGFRVGKRGGSSGRGFDRHSRAVFHRIETIRDDEGRATGVGKKAHCQPATRCAAASFSYRKRVLNVAKGIWATSTARTRT